jgi:beta-lactamase regulating signal transducer with metallopeptidase domain
MLAMPVLTAITPDVPVPLPSFASLPAGSAGVLLPSLQEHGSATDASSRGEERARAAADADPAVVPPVTLRRAEDSTPAITPGWLSLLIAALYLSGVTVFALWLACGYRQLARLAWSSRPIPTLNGHDTRALVDSGDPVFESPDVSAPVTMGILRPRVVLPSDWRAWPASTLRAVLAHEGEHARRRDPLVALLAQANRCAFWFNPVAWWLERTVAAAREQACDEAGLRACDTAEGYAEVVLAMAAAARRGGGRVAWQALDIGGTTSLSSRIRHILSNTARRQATVTCRAAVAAGCALAIGIAAACGPGAPPEADGGERHAAEQQEVNQEIAAAGPGDRHRQQQQNGHAHPRHRPQGGEQRSEPGGAQSVHGRARSLMPSRSAA